MTNVKCGSTINAPLSQITSMKIIIQNSNCSWICPKCGFFNFSDSFFSDQLNLEEQNRFAPLSNDSSCGTKTCESGTNKNKFISGY